MLAVASCTPLGGWIYDDPTFVLNEVESRDGGEVPDTLALTFTGCNRNDFAVLGTESGLSIQLGGVARANRGSEAC